MTRIEFARQVNLLIMEAAKWAACCLGPEDANREMHPEGIQRFIAGMQERLSFMEPR